MKCPRCGYENREGYKFCAECGALLLLVCPSCQAAYEPGQKFCGECGAPLTAEGAAPVAPPPPKPAPAQVPASFVGGRYEVKKFLGEGGKKKVYLAHDTLLDRDVAFALIKTEGLDETARVRIRREAQAMGRLGSHPHIVTVFDLGEQEGQPYMVTEFMGGGDVEHLLEKAAGHRLSVERAPEIAKQVCLGLDFAHAKGIVHRDLKPGNVWLTAEGVAKIGDFGLALPLDRSRLTQEGMMVGTVAYMPPEQAMGGEVTPRADLYSLGCMLYEAVAGRPPFLGDDPVAILGQHVHTPPVAPTWHNPRCPRDLEALILRLLSKDPAQRPESAAEVLTALEGIDLTAIAERPEETRSLDSLAGGVFVGRQQEMGELKGALEEALSGRGRLVMLVGEPGIGKTRTALELATYAGLRQAQVLWGQCYESHGMPPYWPWVQAIRAYVRERDPQKLRMEMGSGAADIAEIVSEVRQRLPDLEPAPPLEDPEAARFRLFDSITTFLKGAARSQPLVLILDDLHWSDKPSLLLLQFVAGELVASRLFVIGCYRDVELSRRHPLAQTLGELARERAFRRVLLRGLSQEDVGRFIELTAGVQPPDPLVRAVYTQTEGNPLFVNEVVRLLVQEGELSPQRLKDRTSWTVRIPEGVREVIGRRLDRLSERCNEVLTVASAIGREFSFGALAKLVEGHSEERLLAVLEEALASRVIEELPRAAGRYQFSHGLIQETLAGELSATRRVRLHARIAPVLEALYGSDAEAHAAELAYHYGEAEAVLGPEKLVEYSLLAGERALAAYGWEEAVAHFQRGLAAREGQPMDAETAALWYGLGRAEAALLMVDEAAKHLTRAFDFYEQAGDGARAAAVATTLLFGWRWHHLMAPVVEQALKLVAPESLEAGRLLCVQAWGLGYGQGDYEGATVLFRKALAIARSQGDGGLALDALAWWAILAHYHFCDQDLKEATDQALPLLTSVDSLQGEVAARDMALVRLVDEGHPTEAMAQGRAALAAAERLRHRVALSTACYYNACLAQALGDWPAARAFFDRELASWPGDERGLSRGALLECELGHFDRAEAYREALLRASDAPARSTGADPLAVALSGRIAGNARWLEAARTGAWILLSSPGATPLTTYMARLALGIVAVEAGDVAAVQEQYAALQAMEQAPRVWYQIYCPPRILGIMAHHIGAPDQAVAHFQEALAFCRKAGYRPELAWSCCDYADLLLERNGPGDHERAMALLDKGLALARELEMRPLMERILSRRKILRA